jgi:hypothetical protein
MLAGAREIPVFSVAEFEQFASRHPDPLAHHPCIIEGFIQRWPAYEKWQNLRYLEEKFGHLTAEAGAPQFVTHKNAKMCQVRTTFSKYLEYVQAPCRAESLFHEAWVRGSYEEFRSLGAPLYCGSLRFVGDSTDPIIDEVRPLVPTPLECWNEDLPYFYELHNHLWVYVSLPGALTPLHIDNNGVIAYLAQFKGAKQVILYSPQDRVHYFNPDVGHMDPLAPDAAEFPTWQEAQAWTATLRAGQLLIWGSEWAHHVLTVEEAISTSLDFVNQTNIGQYARSHLWTQTLGRFAKEHIPLVVSKLSSEVVHAALARELEWQIGRDLMVGILEAALGQGDRPERSRLPMRTMLEQLRTS